MKYNIKTINGNEIIDFLNSLNTDNYAVDDISIELKSFVFECQEIKDNTYILSFTASYNNWGTSQDIPDNQLIIIENNLWFSLSEPFEGDGTDTTLETILTKWLETHEFAAQHTQIDQFNTRLEMAYELLPQIGITNIETMDKIINILTEARSYMKNY